MSATTWRSPATVAKVVPDPTGTFATLGEVDGELDGKPLGAALGEVDGLLDGTRLGAEVGVKVGSVGSGKG